MAKAAAWTVGMRFAVRSIGLVSTVVLARLLQPADFGLVAFASASLAAVEVFGQFGFDVALIRQPNATRSYYDTIWTLSILRGLLIGASLSLLGEPAASFFHDARVAPIVYCFAFGAVVEGFQNVGIVNFQKDMTFGRDFAFNVALKLVGFVVTLTLAITLRQYWALVAGTVAGRVAALLLSYKMSNYRPRLCVAEWRNLLGFSKWLLLNNLILFLYSRMDTFIIGRMLGPHILGLYDISLEISTLPTAELVSPIQRALYPGYAKLAGDGAQLNQHYLSTLAIILSIGFPAAVGIALLPHFIIEIFLGPSWVDAEPLLKLLSFLGLVQVCGANAHPILTALGRVRTLFQIYVIRLALLAASLSAGVYYLGVMGAAYAVLFTSFVTLVLFVVATMRALHLYWTNLILAVWRTLIAGAAMAAGVQFLLAMFPGTQSELLLILELLGVIACGASIYLAAHFTLWAIAGYPEGAEKAVLGIFRHIFARYAS